MIYLVAVSLIWAFSFGLISQQLTGLDANLVAWARMAVALPLFLPFLRWRGLATGVALRLIMIGAIQYGLMYVAYLGAYQYLKGHEVALLTIFTPLFVVFWNDLYQRQRSPRAYLLAVLAVIGAGIITLKPGGWTPALLGFALMQVSNAAFAWGQIAYRRLRPRFADHRDDQVYALLFLGAFLVTALATTFAGSWGELATATPTQAASIVYLGAIATGLGFFLWNFGAVRTTATKLAIGNNLKIPLGVLIALTVFGEEADLVRLLAGGGLMLVAVWLAERWRPVTTPTRR